MHSLLTELGVSPELQAFFGAGELSFTYGNDQETFGPGFHHVPVTADLWMTGSYPATELIITSSAMEAMAYMTLNGWRHPAENALSFIALGLRPQAEQLRWIKRYCLKRKITLVFPNDLCGRLADVLIATRIRDRTIRAVWKNGQVQLMLNNQLVELQPEKLSLNAFEKASAIRTGIRTRKPRKFNSLLDQLRNDHTS